MRKVLLELKACKNSRLLVLSFHQDDLDLLLTMLTAYISILCTVHHETRSSS